jgi:uridine kinase
MTSIYNHNRAVQHTHVFTPVLSSLQEMRIVEVPVYDFTTHQRSTETRRVRCLPACPSCRIGRPASQLQLAW